MAISKDVIVNVKETGLDEVNQKVNKLHKSVEQLEQEQKSLASSMGESSQSVLSNGGAMGLLNGVTSGYAQTVKDTVEASWLFTKSQKAAAIQQSIATTVVGTSTGAMKAFRIALAATGVGLLVLALVALIINFSKVKEAVYKVVPALKAVGEWFEKIINSVTDFVGATSEAERAMDKMQEKATARSKAIDKLLKEEGSRYSESAKKKMAIDKQLQDDIATGEFNVVKLKKEAQAQKDAIDKENAEKTAKIQKDAYDKAVEEVKKRKDEAAAIAKKARDAEEAIAKKARDEADAALKAEDEKRNKIAKEQGEQAREEYEALEKVIADARKASEDALKTENELKVEAENADFLAKKERLIAAGLSIEEVEAEHKRKLAVLSDEYYAEESDKAKERAAEEIAIEQEKSELKKAIADANMDIAYSTLGLMSDLAGKNKAIQKAGIIAEAGLGIFSVVKDTQAATAAAVAPPPIGFGPIAGVPLATRQVVKGALSVAKIAAASAKALSQVGGGSVDGGSAGGGAAPQAPSFNIVQGTGQNQVAETISKQAPVKAFVVSRDMTSGQEMDRNIVNSASL